MTDRFCTWQQRSWAIQTWIWNTILDMSYKMPDNSMGSFMEGVNSLGYESIPS